ncbi:MAG TPA: DNA polymerase IV [Acidimicrobiales bacterium]|nr:DNA polymerase IV [Acidimicrobiales bacterium]
MTTGTTARPELDRCTVLHVDLDAFFASVEVLDDPSLAGLPVIVGGTGTRGVVASCTYEARAFGVRSAMPSVEARRRCPQAVFLSGRFGRYAEVSEQFHALLHRVTPVVEGIGLDEAFLDVAGVRRLLGPALEVAGLVRASVRADLGLDCAVGVARTKFVAKLASRAAKPVPGPDGPRPGPGVVAVAPRDELDFLHPLPVRAMWGVGPATGGRLHDLGVHTVGDLAAIPVPTLCRVLGEANGRHLAALSRGEDPRPVQPNREAKSVGHEETFATDLHRHAALHHHLVRMADGVAERLGRAGLAGRTVTLKVRYGDRTTVTRSHSLDAPVDAPRPIAAVAGALLEALDTSPGVRLLGVSVSGLVPAGGTGRQLSFEDTGGPGGAVPSAGGGGPEGDAPEERAEAWHEVEAAVTGIRARYGHDSVGSAALMGEAGLAVKRRGDTQWGPAADDGSGHRPGGRA